MLKRKEVIMNNGIYRVIQEGTSLMGNPNLNEAMFMAWLDYSRKMLYLVSNNSFVKYQYSSFVYQMMNAQLSPYEKLSKCIDCLIRMIPIM